jgi:hypothetical protein
MRPMYGGLVLMVHLNGDTTVLFSTEVMGFVFYTKLLFALSFRKFTRFSIKLISCS